MTLRPSDVRHLDFWALVLLGLLAGVGALAILHVVNKLAFGDRVMFALDGEGNLPTWFSSTLFVVAGIGSLALALIDARSRSLWLLVGLLFVGFSLDDAIGIHESTEREEGSLSRLIVQPVIVIVLSLALGALGRRRPRPERGLLIAAAIVLVVALVASLLNAYFDPPYAVLVSIQMLEETTEMVVPALVIAAIVAAVARRLGPTLAHA
jgi:hypothetical protein